MSLIPVIKSSKDNEPRILPILLVNKPEALAQSAGRPICLHVCGRRARAREREREREDEENDDTPTGVASAQAATSDLAML